MFFFTAVVWLGLCALAKGGFQTDQAWLDEMVDLLTNWFQKGGVKDWPEFFDDDATFCFDTDLEGCAVGIADVTLAFQGFKNAAEFACIAYEDVVFGEGYFGWRWIFLFSNGDCKEFLYGRSHILMNEFGELTFDFPIVDDIDSFNAAFARVSAPECIDNGNTDSSSSDE